MKQISVFEPQEINGETVEPLCIPAIETTLSYAVAGATNLLWFAFHIALADRNRGEARRLASMLTAVVDEETSEGFAEELEEAIEMLDETQGDGYTDMDES